MKLNKIIEKKREKTEKKHNFSEREKRDRTNVDSVIIGGICRSENRIL